MINYNSDIFFCSFNHKFFFIHKKPTILQSFSPAKNNSSEKEEFNEKMISFRKFLQQ